jgi:hypothetical protein
VYARVHTEDKVHCTVQLEYFEDTSSTAMTVEVIGVKVPGAPITNSLMARPSESAERVHMDGDDIYKVSADWSA